MTPSEVQKLIDDWSKKLSNQKERGMKLKLEAQKAQEEIEKIEKECEELGISVDDIDGTLLSYEKEKKDLENEISSGLKEISEAFDKLEQV